jgi:hypothetical protein
MRLVISITGSLLFFDLMIDEPLPLDDGDNVAMPILKGVLGDFLSGL